MYPYTVVKLEDGLLYLSRVNPDELEKSKTLLLVDKPFIHSNVFIDLTPYNISPSFFFPGDTVTLSYREDVLEPLDEKPGQVVELAVTELGDVSDSKLANNKGKV
jgi:hypothetical protein